MIARRVAIGSASNLVGKAVGIATWFLLTPFILGELGPVEYGIWALVGSLGAYGYLLDLGLAGSVVKYVAEHRARGEWDKARVLVATAVRLYLVLGAVAVVLAVAVAVVAPIIFNIPAVDHATARWAIVLVGLSVGITLAFMPATATLRGLQRYDLYNIVTVTGTLLTAAGTLVALAAGGGLVGMVAVAVPITALTQAVSIVLVRRIAPELRYGWGGGSRREVRPIARFGGALFVINVSTTLQMRTDELVIAAFLPVAAVTPYALARRLSEVSLLFADQFVKVLMPLASELDAVRDVARLRFAFVVAVRLSLAIVMAPSLALIVFAEPALVAWVGAANAGAAPLVVILAVAGIFRAVGWPAASLLQGMARHGRIASLSIASGLANLGLSVVLVQGLGVAGVAVGTLIPTVIESVIILVYGLRVVGIGLAAGVRGTVLPPLVAAVPAVVALVGLRGWLQPVGITAVLPAAIGVAVYLIAYGLLSSTRPEREIVRSLAVGVIRRRRGDPTGG